MDEFDFWQRNPIRPESMCNGRTFLRFAENDTANRFSVRPKYKSRRQMTPHSWILNELAESYFKLRILKLAPEFYEVFYAYVLFYTFKI